jgi:hypothetical protein
MLGITNYIFKPVWQRSDQHMHNTHCNTIILVHELNNPTLNDTFVLDAHSKIASGERVAVRESSYTVIKINRHTQQN